MKEDFLDCVHSHHQGKVIQEQPSFKRLVAPEIAVIIVHRIPIRLEILLDCLVLLVDCIHLTGIEFLAVCLDRQGAHLGDVTFVESVPGGDQFGKLTVAEPSLLLSLGKNGAVALFPPCDEIVHLTIEQHCIPEEMDVAILECEGGCEDAPAMIGEGECILPGFRGNLPLHIGVAPLQGDDVVQSGIIQKRAVRLAHEALVPHEGHLFPVDPGLGKDVRECGDVGDAAAILHVVLRKGAVIPEGEQVDEVYLPLVPHLGVIAELCMVDCLRGGQYPVPVDQNVPSLVPPKRSHEEADRLPVPAQIPQQRRDR